MSVVLLRTLTRKSIIGFGDYKDISVQNMLDLKMHKQLLAIYYTCRNIDFNQDLKDELCIADEREIDKKQPSEKRYVDNYQMHIRKCLYIMLAKLDEKELELAERTKMKLHGINKKLFKQQSKVRSNFNATKGRLQFKNQGHTGKK